MLFSKVFSSETPKEVKVCLASQAVLRPPVCDDLDGVLEDVLRVMCAIIKFLSACAVTVTPLQ